MDHASGTSHPDCWGYPDCIGCCPSIDIPVAVRHSGGLESLSSDWSDSEDSTGPLTGPIRRRRCRPQSPGCCQRDNSSDDADPTRSALHLSRAAAARGPGSASQTPSLSEVEIAGLLASRKRSRRQARWETRYGTKITSILRFLNFFFIFWTFAFLSTTFTVSGNPAYTSPAKLTTEHHVIFDEIGQMAPSVNYVHALVPLNISALYIQGDFIRDYVYKFYNQTHFYTHNGNQSMGKQYAPHDHYMAGLGDVGKLIKLRFDRLYTRLENLDHLLPQPDTDRHIRDTSGSDEVNDFFKEIYEVTKVHDKLYRHPEPHKLDPFHPEYLPASLQAKVAHAQFQYGQSYDHIASLYPEQYLPPLRQLPLCDQTDTQCLTEQLSFYNNLTSSLDNLYQELKPMFYEGLDLIAPQSGTDPTDTFVHVRSKRFALVAGIIGTALLGTFLGIFSATEISSLKSRLNDLESKHDLLVQVSSRHTLQIAELSDKLAKVTELAQYMIRYHPAMLHAQLTSIIDEFEFALDHMYDTFQHLQHHRLAVGTLTPLQLQLLHDTAEKLASEYQLSLLTQKPGDYLQIEVSFVRVNRDALAFVHIPCIPALSLLTMYRYVPFPIALPNEAPHTSPTIHDALYPSHLVSQDPLMELSLNRSFLNTSHLDALIIRPEAEIIAVDKSHRFRIIDNSELAACIIRNHFFICDHLQVLRTDPENFCLGSLYLRHEVGVRRSCHFQRSLLLETVYQVTGSDYLVYSPVPFTTRLTCLNGTHLPLFLHQITRISIPNGCSAQLRQNIITSGQSLRTKALPLVFTWHWNPLSFPADMLDQAHHVDHALNHLSESLDLLVRNTSHLASKAIMDSDFSSLMVSQVLTPTPLTIFVWIIVSLIIVASCSFCCWYWQPCVSAKLATHFRRAAASAPPAGQDPLGEALALNPIVRATYHRACEEQKCHT